MLNFLGIGAQKAGTTWLYEMLRLHGDILFPAGKEVHFWDAHRDAGIEWYESQFAGGPQGRKNGEITPAYAILPLEAIREVHAFNPALRLIFILRNPVERAWSSALMALARAEMTIDEASDQWFADHFRSAGSLQRGDYEQCLRNWRSVFPAGQLLLLRFEMIGTDPRGLLRQCCRHLEVRADALESVPDEILARKAFASPEYPIRESLREVLHRIYDARIERLGAYLQADLTEWTRGG
ncbi:MAG: sulfotransferase [Betaproteobacteria bacterium]|nr:sulfotransferase [Betaproteobacteria bacterium]